VRSHFALTGSDGAQKRRYDPEMRENLEPFAAMLLTLGRPIIVRLPRELMEIFERLAT
jgi:hypothetical protein